MHDDDFHECDFDVGPGYGGCRICGRNDERNEPSQPEQPPDHNCLWTKAQACTICGYHPERPDFYRAVRYERQKQREALDAEDAEDDARRKAGIDDVLEDDTDYEGLEIMSLEALRTSPGARPPRERPDTDTNISPWRNHSTWEDGLKQFNIVTGETREHPTEDQYELAQRAADEEYKRKKKLDPNYLSLDLDEQDPPQDPIPKEVDDALASLLGMSILGTKTGRTPSGRRAPRPPAVRDFDTQPQDWMGDSKPDPGVPSTPVVLWIPNKTLDAIRELANKEGVFDPKLLMRSWIDEGLTKEAAQPIKSKPKKRRET